MSSSNSGSQSSVWNQYWNFWGNMGAQTIGPTVNQITGVTASQDALNLAQQEFQYAQNQNNQTIAQNQWNDQQSQISGSQQAAGAIATQKATSGANPYNSVPTSIGPGGAAM